MAQSPNAMQEPSMDELLASIREIIEENAGLSSSEHGGQNAENGSRTASADIRVQQRQPVNDTGGSALRVARPDARSNVGANVPMQDAMNALAERIGLRKGAMTEYENAAKPVALQPQPVPQAQNQRVNAVRESKPETPQVVASKSQPQQKKRPFEPVKDTTVKDMDEGEKGLRTDVERSAELLLRPYIAQWLDEHFRHLFERILREEIQRFVQALRR